MKAIFCFLISFMLFSCDPMHGIDVKIINNTKSSKNIKFYSIRYARNEKDSIIAIPPNKTVTILNIIDDGFACAVNCCSCNFSRISYYETDSTLKKNIEKVDWKLTNKNKTHFDTQKIECTYEIK
jgi:hypothetical protein